MDEEPDEEARTTPARADGRAPNLTDVARMAGVSLTTASHSFSGRRPVSEATRARVFRVAADLGFDRSDGTVLVAVLMRPPEALSAFQFGTSTFANLAGALHVACLRRRMTVVTATSLDELLGAVRRPDGCVVMYPNRGDTVLSGLLAMDVPTVSFDPDPDSSFSWYLAPDYESSVDSLVTAMHGAGAGRVAALIGQTDNAYRQSIVRAYRRASRRAGREPLVRVVDNGLGQGGALRTMSRLLTTSDPPDAVVTSSSVFARGALDAAREIGLEVPDRFRIASCMDGPAAEFAPTPVTALRIDWNSAAELLIEMLVERLATGSADLPPERHVCDLLTVVRAST